MAFGSTFTLPHADGNVVAVKINQDGYASEYLIRSATSQYTIRIRHSKTKATASRPSYDRHNVEVTQLVFATAEVAEFERKTYVVIEQLPGDLDVKNLDALSDWLIATSNANILSLLGWES